MARAPSLVAAMEVANSGRSSAADPADRPPPRRRWELASFDLLTRRVWLRGSAQNGDGVVETWPGIGMRTSSYVPLRCSLQGRTRAGKLGPDVRAGADHRTK